jgi:hypothetical protein
MNAITRVLKMKNCGPKQEITVRVSWPIEDKSAWSCEWEIQWPNRKRANSARGIDGIQAITNALQMIGSEIYCSEEHKAGGLSWSEKWIGYGFPVPSNIRNLLVGNDKEFL